MGTIAIAYAAFKGFSQWRDEMEGKARVDFVKRFGVLALDLKDQFRSARSSFGPFAEEYKDRIKIEGETDEERQLYNMQFAYLQRLKPLTEIIREMQVLNWEAQILFDDDFTPYVNKYWDGVMDLRTAIIGLFHPASIRAPLIDNPHHLQKREQYEYTLYGGMENDDDEFATRIKQNTEDLTALLKSYISSGKPHKKRDNQDNPRVIQLEKRNSELEQEVVALKAHQRLDDNSGIEKHEIPQALENQKKHQGSDE